jgi:hypothetical protein
MEAVTISPIISPSKKALAIREPVVPGGAPVIVESLRGGRGGENGHEQEDKER